MDQSCVSSVSITTSGVGAQSGGLTYVDGNGDTVTATSADSKIVEELKFIRKQWAAGKSVEFEFTVSVGCITGLVVTQSKPSGS
jgi:hypothetical protein